MSIQSSSGSRTTHPQHDQKTTEVADLVDLANQLNLEGATPENVELLRWATPGNGLVN